MSLASTAAQELDAQTCDFYLRSMARLDEAEIPYLVGGAYSLKHHAGIERHTKDLDLFVRPADAQAVLDLFQKAGHAATMTFPHWLGKVYAPAAGSMPDDNVDAFIDVIFGSGNGLCRVDDDWFAHAVEGEALGRPARLCPAEEIIWTKCFIQERGRYDFADVAHLLMASDQRFDWARLQRRFAGHEGVLLSQLILFRYAFPSERTKIPQTVIDELAKREGATATDERICRGTFLSRVDFLIDTAKRGYVDARVQPRGPMRAEDVTYWTWAIDRIR